MQREIQRENLSKQKIGDFTFLKRIGRGSYSEVLEVSHNVSQKEFALKIIKKKQIFREGKQHEVFIEKLIL